MEVTEETIIAELTIRAKTKKNERWNKINYTNKINKIKLN